MASALPPRLASTPLQSVSHQCSSRQFSTSTTRSKYKQVRNGVQSVIPKDSIIPQYPWGPARWYKQSNKGLYGGLMIRSGNNVGETFGVKTRRKWRPNIQPHTLYSRSLQRPIKLRVATRVLRTIDKVGGLDEYLVGSSKPARLKELGMTGWALRWRVLQTEEMRRRFGIDGEDLGWLGRERRARGLDEEGELVEGEEVREFDRVLDEEAGREEREVVVVEGEEVAQGMDDVSDSVRESLERSVPESTQRSVGETVQGEMLKEERGPVEAVLDDEPVQTAVDNAIKAKRGFGDAGRQRTETTKSQGESASKDAIGSTTESQSEAEPQMIQPKPSVMDKVKGLFGRGR